MRNILLLILTLFIASCSGASSSSSSGISVTFKIKDASGLEVTSITAGSSVIFELALTNTTTQDISYSSENPAYDYTVVQGDIAVWSPTYGAAFPAVIIEGVIKPSQSLIYTANWDGLDNSNNTLPSGIYTVSPSLSVSVTGSNLALEAPASKNITLN